MLHAHSTEFNYFKGLERVLKTLLSFKKGIKSGEFFNGNPYLVMYRLLY